MGLRDDYNDLLQRVEELEERVEELENGLETDEPDEPNDPEPFIDAACEERLKIAMGDAVRSLRGTIQKDLSAFVTGAVGRIVEQTKGDIGQVVRMPRLLEHVADLGVKMDAVIQRQQRIFSERARIADNVRRWRPDGVNGSEELRQRWAPLMNDLADAIKNESV